VLVFSATIAVNMFFFVSGFLVTASYVRRHSLWTFVKSRALRIYPALAVCVILCTFVLGPAVTVLPLRTYFSDPRTYLFFAVNGSLLAIRSFLPGVFEANHFFGVVNGSLWTLPGEAQMYAYVAAMGVLGVLYRRLRFAIALAFLVAFAVVAHHRVNLVSLPDYYGFGGFFAAGACCWMFRDRVPVNGPLLVALIGLCFITYARPVYWPVFAVTTAYFCLWFIYVPGLQFLDGVGDYSYGLYLYGFPMQQLVAWRFPALGPWALFATSFPLALGLGIASWHLVEKPALTLKPPR
jgi:peptidoglycan/LPS O-acetylase OafA/YrhL